MMGRLAGLIHVARGDWQMVGEKGSVLYTPIPANTSWLSWRLWRVVAVGASLVKGGHAIM